MASSGRDDGDVEAVMGLMGIMGIIQDTWPGSPHRNKLDRGQKASSELTNRILLGLAQQQITLLPPLLLLATIIALDPSLPVPFKTIGSVVYISTPPVPTLAIEINNNTVLRTTQEEMPHFHQRQVGFVPVAAYSRPPTATEYAAIHNYSFHASHCRRCAAPYETFLNGETLCERGHGYAIDVADFVYEKAGNAYSTTDREDGNVPVQIEIPHGCGVVRGLLRAISEGLRLRHAAPPVVSYDPTYYVAPRPVERHDRVTVIPDRPSPLRRKSVAVRYPVAKEPPRPAARDKVYYYDSERRGSLYARDLAERRSRYSSSGLAVDERDYYDPRFHR
ncbi:MAG: hypothetical protein M1819_003377 [Sarea resinae]|nr:MAG: hypothetical protein M1819_003377 [Sarea resinae]